MTIEKGKEVSINYILKIDGTIIDSSEEGKPMVYTHGDGKMIPGFSKELEGLTSGDKKNFTLSPEEGYGKVNPEAFQEVPKKQLSNEIEPKVGMGLQATTPDGKTQLMQITQVKENSIVIDLNHPLAGKTLDFEVEIVSVK